MRYLSPIRNRAGRIAICILVLPMVLSVLQTQSWSASKAPAILPPDTKEMVRDIRDFSSGARWILLRDPAQPGGPGKLLLIRAQDSPTQAEPIQAKPQLPWPGSMKPVIRAGDTITIEVHTAAADAWLDAVALSPARQGAPVLARTTFGGSTVHAIAAGRGRAILTCIEGWR